MKLFCEVDHARDIGVSAGRGSGGGLKLPVKYDHFVITTVSAGRGSGGWIETVLGWLEHARGRRFRRTRVRRRIETRQRIVRIRLLVSFRRTRVRRRIESFPNYTEDMDGEVFPPDAGPAAD